MNDPNICLIWKNVALSDIEMANHFQKAFKQGIEGYEPFVDRGLLSHHMSAVFPLMLTRERQSERVSRSGHGLGRTESENPEMFEHSQGMEETEFIVKFILERHMFVKGDSCSPAKLPATVMFVPIISCKIMWSKSGRALGSNLSSGWDPQ